MVRYAAQAIPWARVAVAGTLIILLIELVRWDPWVLWPLQGTAIGLLAGATAWCFDEPAALVVDVTPRGLAWRMAARAPAMLGLALVWCAAVWHAGDSAFFGYGMSVLCQGMVAMAVGAGYAAWRRVRGDAMPGLVAATTLVPLISAWALVRPFEASLPVFPYGDSSSKDWTASTMGWVALGTVALVVLTAALTDAPWWFPATCRKFPRHPPAVRGTAPNEAAPPGSPHTPCHGATSGWDVVRLPRSAISRPTSRS